MRFISVSVLLLLLLYTWDINKIVAKKNYKIVYLVVFIVVVDYFCRFIRNCFETPHLITSKILPFSSMWRSISLEFSFI